MLINLTQHTITFLGPSGEKVELPPSGAVARASLQRGQVAEVIFGGLTIPVYKVLPAGQAIIPPAVPGVHYVVSRLVAEVCSDRDDLLVPDDLVRDEEGRVLGCRALARV